MPAGDSALQRSRELDDDAEALFSLAKVKRRAAESYRAASESERTLSGRLGQLPLLGWVVLEDRRWPASRSANVDFILVGPGGVVVLDAKAWSDVEVRDGGLWHGEAREDDEIDKVLRLIDQLADCVVHLGLTPSALSAAMVFTGRSLDLQLGTVSLVGDGEVVAWLARLPHRFDPERIEAVASALAEACPRMPPVVTPRKILGRQRPVPARLDETEPLIDVEAITQALVDTALAGPIEDWMTFLHPSQSRLVRSTWNGPARIRGAAGTGKTVVGLHRAVHLAQRSSDPVLFVSYVRTLPIVLRSLAERMSPSIGTSIEFVGVHRLASEVLRTVEEPIRVDVRRANQAFNAAWYGSEAAQRLSRLDERPGYWREEIDHVLKGRGIVDRDRYLTLQRVGRKTPMRADDRRAMWDLYVGYEKRLEAADAHDFNDLVLRARVAVQRYPDLFRYSAVIVDEVQDLNLAAVQFLSALAGDAPNSLLFVGDGQQSVYPGGFTLAEAGISVTGRAAVLNSNYRNTVEILAEAQRIVSADTFDDLEGLPEAGDRAVECTRHGHAPLRVDARTQRDLDAALTHQLHRTRAQLGTPWGDLAVLCERTRSVEHTARVLSAAGIPHVELHHYDGVTTDKVKIGTIKRAKGLEFKYVLLPGLSKQPPDQVPGETDDSYAERVERWRRELYVAMTRARDGLWLGYLQNGTR